MAYNFTAIEKKWQKYWLENKTFRALDPHEAGGMPKAYVLAMFPYPSGAGLHVGHAENYTAPDIVARYLRMKGANVLHPIGWDAFGLPAEQAAIKTNTHPRKWIAANIENFRRQFTMLGLGYDWDREINTTDPQYYKWTQWIFLQLFNSYFDPIDRKAKPIGHLMQELVNENYVVAPDGEIVINPVHEGMEAITGEMRIERLWRELSPDEQLDVIDAQRLAYMDEVAVNWCPGLGTVLANEEVIDGKSEVGGFPVERRPMRQWMLRITAYADRLIEDLNLLQWPESLKEMQRNWIGKSVGAEVDFPLAGAKEDDDPISVFTTRPDTLFGATYMVLAPEHPLVDRITTEAQRQAVEAYRQMIAGRSERDRIAETKDKTGVFTGAYAVNPVNNEKIPIWVADYVLMSYGTGAIMAVPAHDERDFEFARKYNLPIRVVVTPVSESGTPGEEPDQAFTGDGISINSGPITNLPTSQAKEKIIDILERDETGQRSIKYKLRDWLFSRQRYWGEPFPILLDETGRAHAIDESELPLTLPELADFKPTGTPEPPLSKAKDWLRVTIDGKTYTRETNTMPQWAGSCWYYLRFCDPKNPNRFVDPIEEKYWMPVDLYVGGVEHAVLHLLYARFWHKVLFDLGHVSTPEPFMRLVNQGIITGEMEYHVFQTTDGQLVSAADVSGMDEEATEAGVIVFALHNKNGEKLLGRRVSEDEVERVGHEHRLRENPNIVVDARSFKMSKSRGNVANPDDLVRDYGADALRLYVMYLGPLEAQKPWNTRDIVGMTRFLNSVARNLGVDTGGVTSVTPSPIPEALDRQMHRTIKKVAEDIEAMRFNTAIAELIKLNNEVTGLTEIPRELAENFALMLSPFAPHLAEEIWEKLGHHKSLSHRPWPTFDPAKLTESMMELPVQVNGKVRDRITVPADASQDDILALAEKAPALQTWIAGKTIKKRLYVEKRLINFVVA
jgi:leucyl-tRNA synthetase